MTSFELMFFWFVIAGLNAILDQINPPKTKAGQAGAVLIGVTIFVFLFLAVYSTIKHAWFAYVPVGF